MVCKPEECNVEDTEEKTESQKASSRPTLLTEKQLPAMKYLKRKKLQIAPRSNESESTATRLKTLPSSLFSKGKTNRMLSGV